MPPRLRHTAKMETVDNHGLLLLKRIQFLLATPLNAKQSQLLTEEMMASKETTSFQTSVLTMILSQLIRMLQPPDSTVDQMELDADNHGMLLLRKHQSQLATLLNAKLRLLLTPSSRKIPIHGIKTTQSPTS